MNKYDNYKNFLKKKLVSKYGIHKIGDKEYMKFSNFGLLLHAFPDVQAFCIEYSDNMEQVKQWIFLEDGELFYVSDMTKSEILNSMIKEIEDNVDLSEDRIEQTMIDYKRL